jgi:hypothetical protein
MVCVEATWRSRDYFAEMYVAGVLADAGWNVYFPRRDQGFDMMATLPTTGGVLIRPVQVKGKYPTEGKTDKGRYGFVGALTAMHPDMVLAIPLFAGLADPGPMHVAWIPAREIRSTPGGGHRCEPAKFVGGVPRPRSRFVGYFDEAGLAGLAAPDWGATGEGRLSAERGPDGSPGKRLP